MEWIIQAPILFFSIILHEFSHGYMAYRKGDDTAHLSGRLTFNPIAHIDPFGTIILPALCVFSNMPLFGWAKPVPVNPYKMHNPVKDIIKVAGVGPLSNLALALLAAVVLRLSLFIFPIIGQSYALVTIKALFFTIQVNLVLAFFNLIPVFPLDGSQILNGLLPEKYARIYEKHAHYGMWIILGLMLTRTMQFLIIPPMTAVLTLFAYIGLLPNDLLFYLT